MSLDVLTLAVAKSDAVAGASGHDGADGFSPVITEDESNQEGSVYKLKITNKDGFTITTPNLIGKKGDKGDNGADGQPGTPGVAGPKGDAGQPGAVGPAGVAGKDGANGKNGKSITAITLTVDENGKVTGGTATLGEIVDETSTITITVTEQSDN